MPADSCWTSANIPAFERLACNLISFDLAVSRTILGATAIVLSAEMPPPLFSIIIPCRNAGTTIAATLKSLRSQAAPDMEVVIVDGGSMDSTHEVVAGFGDVVTRFLSEPDDGVYAAMNKGTRLARGEWFLFLGADDQLASSDVLAQMRPRVIGAASGIVCGEAQYRDGRIWPAPVAPNVRYRNFMHHQSSFYRRQLFADGGYDESLRIQGDYDFNLRLWRAGVRPTPVPVRVAVCECGGLSDGGSWANYREEIKVRHRHFADWQCWFWDLGSVARCFRKWAVRGYGTGTCDRAVTDS